jgi:hypothetical protein
MPPPSPRLPQLLPPAPDRSPILHPGIDTQADHKQNQDFQRRRVEVHRLRGYDVGAERSSIPLQSLLSQLSPTCDCSEDGKKEMVKL